MCLAYIVSFHFWITYTIIVKSSLASGCTSIIAAFRRPRQEDHCELKAGLDYRARSHLKNSNNNKHSKILLQAVLCFQQRTALAYLQEQPIGGTAAVTRQVPLHRPFQDCSTAPPLGRDSHPCDRLKLGHMQDTEALQGWTPPHEIRCRADFSNTSILTKQEPVFPMKNVLEIPGQAEVGKNSILWLV